MKNSRIVHVIGLDKFIPPFIDLLERQEYFPRHLFFISGDEKRFPVKRCGNTVFSNEYSNKISATIGLVTNINRAEKVILHGLFDSRIIFLLFLQPWLLKKCYWVMWGADLYNYQPSTTSWKEIINKFIRRVVIKNIGHLVTYIEGDVNLARKWYGAKGQYHECIMYTSNIYRKLDVQNELRNTINIQIGNSADIGNYHLDILEKLRPFRYQNIAIYAPLSYGDKAYAKTVIDAGKAIFGDKFKPMTDFIPFDRYLDFLGKIDIAVFNHKRQQAMGNTVTLLGLGKKVYMRSDITPWTMFEKLQVKVFDIDNLNLKKISEEVKNQNSQGIKSRFSESTLLSELKDIFEG